MSKKETKAAAISQLKEDTKDAQVAIIGEYFALNAKEFTNLRGKLRKHNAKANVVKNTLAKLAFAESAFSQLGSEHWKGRSLLVLGKDDPSETIKLLLEIIKELPENKLKIRTGALSGDEAVLDTAQLQKIGSLPSKEVLLAQIAGALVSTPTTVARSVNSVIGDIGELAVKVAEKNN